MMTATATLSGIWVKMRIAFPKWVTLKINPKSVAHFLSWKSDRQSTTFTTHSTTNSPSKHHVLPPVFAKTPCKTGKHHTKKLLATKFLLQVVSWLLPVG
jgi:hypothetical protein